MEQRDWLEMVNRTLVDRSLGGRTDAEGAMAAFRAHEAAVRAAVPPDRLLVFEARDGWAPLCALLGRNVPEAPYPRTNSRDEFSAILTAGGLP